MVFTYMLIGISGPVPRRIVIGNMKAVLKYENSAKHFCF